jgi:pyroglutamyl-peptidase
MVLLTGFNRFGNWEENPSELIVRAIASRARESGDADLVAEVLPTEYQRGADRMRESIRELRPEAILALGVAAGAPLIRLERTAVNLDDVDLPDNAGQVIRGQLIEPGGPASYQTSLPLAAMHKALQGIGIPTVISNDAGAFLCNHVFYIARHEVETLGLASRAGFIHVPGIAGQPGAGLPLPFMIEAIETCLNLLRTRQTSTLP